jgi:hypothetical protein
MVIRQELVPSWIQQELSRDTQPQLKEVLFKSGFPVELEQLGQDIVKSK